MSQLNWEAECTQKFSGDLQYLVKSEQLILEEQKQKIDELQRENAKLEKQIFSIKV